jgi:hypothetical protein
VFLMRNPATEPASACATAFRDGSFPLKIT